MDTSKYPRITGYQPSDYLMWDSILLAKLFEETSRMQVGEQIMSTTRISMEMSFCLVEPHAENEALANILLKALQRTQTSHM